MSSSDGVFAVGSDGVPPSMMQCGVPPLKARRQRPDRHARFVSLRGQRDGTTEF
ncbi:MAG: hypothetical protein IKR62_04340 [Victivallales bacterium]|nr:hypothetical protein [Victivallales bacterium]